MLLGMYLSDVLTWVPEPQIKNERKIGKRETIAHKIYFQLSFLWLFFILSFNVLAVVPRIVMSKHRKVFNWHCFEKFTRTQLVNMKIVVEPLRNS